MTSADALVQWVNGVAGGAGSARATAGAASADLKALLDAYERILILAALGATRGQQRRAAALLSVLPTTLHAKIKRLGIAAYPVRRVVAHGGDHVRTSLRWTGTLPPGGTVEMRGFNGPIRIEPAEDDEVKVVVNRSGCWAAVSATEVKILEHERGMAAIAVCDGSGVTNGRNRSAVRVDFLARVPADVRVVASTVNDDIEVIGISANVEAVAVNGYVRFLAHG